MAFLLVLAACAQVDDVTNETIQVNEELEEDLPDYSLTGDQTWCVVGDFFRIDRDGVELTSVIRGFEEFRGQTMCRSESRITRNTDDGPVATRRTFYFNQDRSSVILLEQTLENDRPVGDIVETVLSN